MSGDILGGVTGMVSAVTSVVGIFAKLHDSKYEKKIQICKGNRCAGTILQPFGTSLQ